MGGHVSQLAKAVMIYSPWQFLYWYDRPEGSPGKKGGAGDSDGFIKNHPELEFYKLMPTVWDETKVLEGKIGEFATIARRAGNEWFLGSLTANQARKCSVDFDFLEDGVGYTATIYTYDPESKSTTKVKIEKLPVTSEKTIDFEIEANSGIAMHIQP
jgi:alpha-glucosidase